MLSYVRVTDSINTVKLVSLVYAKSDPNVS